MPDSLATLVQQRDVVLQQMVTLGDFRSGSITSTSGKCGKPNCHCHQPGQPVHGPSFRLTRKIARKTVTQTFSSPAELRKAQTEVAAFHRFRELSQQLLEINEKICRARPVEQPTAPQEKKRQPRSSKKSRAK